MNIHFYQGKTNKLESENKDDNHDDSKDLEIIKNTLLDMFNVKNLHFLFGSGTSRPAIPTMNELFSIINNELQAAADYEQAFQIKEGKYEEVFEEFKRISENEKIGQNIEEILGALYSHLIYLKAIKVEDSDDSYLICKKLVEEIEKIIFDAINVDFNNNTSADATLNTYKLFYSKIALRSKDLSRINIFTTNNDLFNERALDSLNIHYINGFSGGLNRFFIPGLFNYTFSKRMDTSIDKFEPVENMVYLYKLHGSINWTEDTDSNNRYFNIKEITSPSREHNNILIYPTPTKQNKSLGSPYTDIFREFQRKLLEPNSVLFIIGYSFSDEHVNNIIYQALATNSTINVIIINNITNNKVISDTDDNRIYRIWSENNQEGTDQIHYFKFIVEELFPNLDAFRKKDKTLEDFIASINNKNN